LSIFISIPTLKDPEILNTIFSAFQHADNPKSVSMGVAAFVDEEFYGKLTHYTNSINNLFIDMIMRKIRA
jgi:hypothetical protein